MSNMPLTDGINALTRYANETTGKSDTTLSDAVESLVAGYGGGGGWSTDGIIAGTEPSGAISSNATTACYGALAGNSAITSLYLPLLETVKERSFNRMSALTNFVAPKMTYTESYLFANSTALKSIDILGAAKIDGRSAIANNSFENCYAFDTMIIRNTSEVMKLNNLNAFNYTPFRGYNSQTGTLYASSSLVESYKTANNWKSLYEAGFITILPIEGSIYETQYADGTPITT